MKYPRGHVSQESVNHDMQVRFTDAIGKMGERTVFEHVEIPLSATLTDASLRFY